MIYKHYTIGGELYHHGIYGQKWGVKNGPPYPLGSGDHSASEKKAGWRKSLKKSGLKKVIDNYKAHRKAVKDSDELIKEIRKPENDGRQFKDIQREVDDRIIDMDVDRLKINDDGHYKEMTIKGGEQDIYVIAFSEDVDDQRFKDVTKKILKNKEDFKDAAFDAIKREKIYEDWVKQNAKSVSEEEFKDKIGLGSIWIHSSNLPTELSFYEKEDKDNLLGGHSMDVEVDENNPKKKIRWVTMNG